MDFDAALSFLRVEIDKDLRGEHHAVHEGYLESFVTERSGIKDVLTEDMRQRLVKHLETFYGTTQGDGHSLNFDFKEWYPERKNSDDFNSYFWRRLKKHWADHSILPIEVISSIDRVTDEILGYLGDPLEEAAWKRSGLVMGHVQSGKTTNYSALITKAADAGYRIIVVLAGLTNSLRKQTQERLDQTFVGKSSLGDALNNQAYPVARVFVGIEGEPQDPRHPFCGTTQRKDFSVETTRSVSATEGSFADPILFVTKKNERVLARLAEWLGSLRQGKQLEGPMLLIDDEADSASVNTAKDGDAVRRINQRIRELLRCSRRSSYVGYTATPFANIFIDPDTTDEMLNEDLFPKHFIKSLDPPDNYVGARNLFADDGDLADVCVKDIPDDYVDLLPLKHKSSWEVHELPPSLIEAVVEYFLFRSIRILDGEKRRHSSMLVNVSRFNMVQQQIHDHIYRLKERIGEAASVWAASVSWSRSEHMLLMKRVWDKAYADCTPYSWDEVRSVLKKAVSPVETRLVNMRGSGLDYESHEETGLHVIAVGGLALARGLTLEGLAISYVLRNVGAADTLLQMGRWFGYRPGYAHLCRIHLTEEMIGHFNEISASVEELRDDLVRMEKMRRPPDQFGLKVRHSPTGIAITAANKMRTAQKVRMSADYSGKHVQAYELVNSEEQNERHLTAVHDLVGHLGGELHEDDSALVWKNVGVDQIQSFLRGLDMPQLDYAQMSDGRSLVLDYIADRASGELASWDVAIPHKRTHFEKGVEKRRLPVDFDGQKELFCRQRFSAVWKAQDSALVKVTAKNVVADLAKTDLIYGEDSQALEAKKEKIKANHDTISDERAILLARERPLMIVHLLQLGMKDGQKNIDKFQLASVPVVSVSLGFPGTEVEAAEHDYAASIRMMQLLERQREEAETDEEFEEDA